MEAGDTVVDEISSKVVSWAHGKLGQRVGRGECWDLVDAALKAAGARSSTTKGHDDDYNWGTAIRLEEVAPGDVLQFRDFVVTTRTDKVVRFPDGRISSSMAETLARRPHHSAIVYHVDGGGQFRVYEQHVKPAGPRVQDHVVPTRNVAAFRVVTHEVVKAGTGALVTATVETTTTITVSGSVWAYRPEQ